MACATILICTRNRANSLRETLAALNGVTVPPGISLELMVVDNDSSDGTASVVRDFRFAHGTLTYLKEPTPGLSRAKNRGLAEAAGEIIVCLDDDVIPARDWLPDLCAPIITGEADAVAGCVRLAPHLVAAWMTTCHHQWLAASCGLDAKNPERLIGANMAFARSVLERVPAFDVEIGPGGLGAGTDTLFSEQLKAAGYRLATAFDSVVEHHFSKDRLHPLKWMKAAAALGRQDAYIGHHWEHIHWPRPRLMVCVTLLKMVHQRIRLALSPGPVVPESLLNATRSFHARLHYLRERKKPRNYEKHGLRKLHGEMG